MVLIGWSLFLSETRFVDFHSRLLEAQKDGTRFFVAPNLADKLSLAQVFAFEGEAGDLQRSERVSENR